MPNGAHGRDEQRALPPNRIQLIAGVASHLTMSNTRRLGPFNVSPIGMGCMNISHAYGEPPSVEQGERVLLTALDAGDTLMDTAALYGFGANETLIGRVLKAHRKNFVLTSKCGLTGETFPDGSVKRAINGRPDAIRRHCEASLQRLQTDAIDVYYLHRVDKAVPVEESVGAMARLLREGKVRALGLSEVSATTLRRAHQEHPIVAVQNEYSLWTRNPEIGVLQACRDIGATMVAFSPVARGFLTGALNDVSNLHAKDIRRSMPRFEPETYAKNLSLLAAYRQLAHEADCTPSQLALAWLLHKADHIVPIPGTTSESHARENLAAVGVKLTPSLMQKLEALINQNTVVGTRYNAATQKEIDTETFADEAAT